MASSDTPFSNAKFKEVEKAMIDVPSKRTLFYQNFHGQEFSFPDSIIYYITKNPSSTKVYEKLIQSCKYFFDKHPLLIVSSLSCYYIFKILGWHIYFGKKLVKLENVLSQLWITDDLYVNGLGYEGENVYSFTSSIIPKIYRCEFNKIILRTQNISYKEYIFLTSNVEDFACEMVTITNDNGSIVALEDLVAVVPKVKIFRFENHISNIITPKTVQELLQLPHFLKLDEFFVENITESFDIETFFVYAKTNNSTEIILLFCDYLSEAYKDRLHKVINEIVAAKTHNYRIPRIAFPGDNDKELCEKYFRLRFNQPS